MKTKNFKGMVTLTRFWLRPKRELEDILYASLPLSYRRLLQIHFPFTNRFSG
jgi:hypothetical protein